MVFHICFADHFFHVKESSTDYWKEDDGGGNGEIKNSDKRYIWIDAAANFPDFANSKENT